MNERIAGNIASVAIRALARGLLMAFIACFLIPTHGLAGSVAEKKVTGEDGYSALAAKAQAEGTVRILVGVNTSFTPEGKMSKKAALAQRAAISAAQTRVLAELTAERLTPAQSYSYTYIPYLAMTVDQATLDKLIASDRVTTVSEDTADLPDDGWDIPIIGADVLHSAGVTGSGVAVAVLDTGVDKNHPYLSGAVISEACYSSNDGSGGTSLCPGGAASSTAAGSALPYGNGVCPSGGCDHGTHVAGTVAGRSGVQGSPGPGVAPAASIIAIQVFTYSSSGSVTSYQSDQIKGLERVLALKEILKDTHTIASANMSLGGSIEYTTPSSCDGANAARKAAIDNLRAEGIATVISSGNKYWCGGLGAPGCISTAVSVGATDSSDNVADYSNTASFLSLLAPGSCIDSSIPGGQWGTAGPGRQWRLLMLQARGLS